MDSRLPLSPWASDGFFLLVRRLPGWPQAMWGHRRSYCVTSAFGDSHRTPRGARASDNMPSRHTAWQRSPVHAAIRSKSRSLCSRVRLFSRQIAAMIQSTVLLTVSPFFRQAR